MQPLSQRLWFGDERGYNATAFYIRQLCPLLWFGDERGYNATRTPKGIRFKSCGLVMKEDITQQRAGIKVSKICCGLVMKEDITQPQFYDHLLNIVVVW